MTKQSPVMRLCISCRQTYDRKNMLRITNDFKRGVTLNNGFGRSAYICKSKDCSSDSKVKKKLQKALKTVCDTEFFDIFEKKIANYN